MAYRTRTYIAADWESDYDAVEQLHKWNDSKYWSLSFTDAHELQQSRDDSLNCSIKASLKKRMDSSKRFVLIVGNGTNSVRSGGCQYCSSYNSYGQYCGRGYSVDYRSYIEYECDKAIDAGIDIVVLYKAAKVDYSKCPEGIRNYGKHIPMYYWDDGMLYWNYNKIKSAFE